MPYKIKKPHKCENHLTPVTRLFLGFENQPLAILEKDRQIARFGMLLQCTICKTVGVVPLAEEAKDLGLIPVEENKVCKCVEGCKCQNKTLSLSVADIETSKV